MLISGVIRGKHGGLNSAHLKTYLHIIFKLLLLLFCDKYAFRLMVRKITTERML